MSKSGADTELEVTLSVVASLAANPRSLGGASRSCRESDSEKDICTLVDTSNDQDVKIKFETSRCQDQEQFW